jgi:DNA-binding Lrp family transcriptional regulator
MTARAIPAKEHKLSALQQSLLNDYQRELPMSATPFADMAARLGVSEDEVIDNLRTLRQRGYISRVGPVFRPNRVGASTLAAMAVPEDCLEHTAAIVSAFDEVNHNYERGHEYNLWFVVTASDEMHLDDVLEDIGRQTGYPVMSLPMLEDYHIDLGFTLSWV